MSTQEKVTVSDVQQYHRILLLLLNTNEGPSNWIFGIQSFLFVVFQTYALEKVILLAFLSLFIYFLILFYFKLLM